MYISRTEIAVKADEFALFKAATDAIHTEMHGADGFRWAMLLRSMDDANAYASIAMWLSPQHEEAWRNDAEANSPAHGYDVTTARGTMTPATAVAIVDWRVDADLVARFTSRWNAVYHAIEDRIGSRLMQDLAAPTAYTAVHVVTDTANLKPDVLSAELTDPEGLAITPNAVTRYEVVLLTEPD
jgi:heme-degrading monooxygenase HmoA